MAQPSIVAKRAFRTADRKKAKEEYDSILQLSSKRTTASDPTNLNAKQTDGYFRLLDEGMIISSDSYPLFYIMKGTIQSYYDNLSEDFIGSINLGHMDFASFPILIGTWTKGDLKVVDIGDGRKALDVKVKLNEDLNIVKDLKSLNYTLGLSSEIYMNIDQELSDIYELDFVNEIDMEDFAVVGEAGNVNSSDIQLKGDANVSLLETALKKLKLDQKEEPAKDPKPTELSEDKEAMKGPEGVPGIVEPEAETKLSINERLELAAKSIEGFAKREEEAVQMLEQLSADNKSLKEEKEMLEAKVKELEESNKKKDLATEKGLSKFDELVKKLNLDADLQVEADLKPETKNTKEKPITNGFGEV